VDRHIYALDGGKEIAKPQSMLDASVPNSSVPNSSVSAFFCIYMYRHVCWIGLMHQNLTGWLDGWMMDGYVLLD
jgi:hypothetical protein